MPPPVSTRPPRAAPRAAASGRAPSLASPAARVGRAAMLALWVAGAGPLPAQEGPTPSLLDERDPGGRLVGAPLAIGWSGYAAEWALPDADPVGLVVLAHGFLRRCAHLRGTSRALRDAGLAVLCLDAGMARGNPALADALAGALLSGLRAPDGRVPPARVVVAGHSAGGAFAARLGAALARRAPQRLAGALLFDPVGAGGFDADLRALSAGGLRPVRAIVAGPGPCNAQGVAVDALRSLAAQARSTGGDAFVGVQLLRRATHVDVEGDDTEPLAWSACGDGPPQPDNMALLRRLAAGWARDMATRGRGDGLYPGAPALRALREAGRLRTLE